MPFFYWGGALAAPVLLYQLSPECLACSSSDICFLVCASSVLPCLLVVILPRNICVFSIPCIKFELEGVGVAL
jgi:hypothetical protein